MFWVCYGEFRGSKRLRRTWIVEADSSPDEPDESGECAYPFNGMGGYVWHGYGTREHGYNTREEALQVEYELRERGEKTVARRVSGADKPEKGEVTNSMFWVCYRGYRSGSRRVHRTWVIQGERSPDELDENGECLFTEMGGYVEGGYSSYDLAREAENDLLDRGMMPRVEPPEVVEGEVVGGQVKVLFPDGTELMCRVGPTNLSGKTLIWVPVRGTWLKMWKSQELLKEIVPKGEVLLAESSADPRRRG